MSDVAARACRCGSRFFVFPVATRILLGLCATLFLLGVGSKHAAAQTHQGTEITTLPSVISAPGSYYLRGDLSANLGSGAAVTVNASGVTIDLNGRALVNSAATADGSSKGIVASDRARLTVRNGRIEGFATGVAILDSAATPSASYGHLLERLEVSGSSEAGIQVSGASSAVARCRVVGMNASATSGNAYGIWMSGSGCRLLDNEVSGGGLPAARAASATGICVAGADSSGFVVKNRVGEVGQGIWFQGGAQGPYRNNLVFGANHPFIGGTNAGGNVPTPTGDMADSDGNGLADVWELQYFGAIGQDPDGDPDEDGASNLQEFQTGANPLDYYNGQVPSLTIVSGDGQSGSPGAFLGTPLVVRVADSAGQALANAPVVFSVTFGGGFLAPTGQTSPATAVSLTARTDANGQAACRFQLPAGGGSDCVIAATASGLAGVAPPPAARFSAHGQPQGSVPAAPDSVSAVSPSASVARLSWTKHSTDETGFALERSADNGATWTERATVGANTLAYTDYTVSAGAGYIYRLSAFNATGRSPATLTPTPVRPARATVAGKSAAFSPVGGAVTLQAPAADESALSLPFATRPVAFGKVSGVAASTLTLTGINFIAGQFKPGFGAGQQTTHYVQFTSGALAGLALPIVDNSADTLTLGTESVDLTAHPLGAAAAGDLIKVCPCHTVADVLGATENALSVEVSPGGTDLRDHVLIPDYATAGIDKAPALDLVYLHGAGWRKASDLGGADCGNVALLPGRAFKVRRFGNSPATLIATGFAPTHRTVLRVVGGGGGTVANDTLLALAYPEPISLDGAGLVMAADPASGVIAPGMDDPATAADEVRLHQSFSINTPGASGGVETVYRATGNGWVKLGAAAETDTGAMTLLQPGGAVLLRKTPASPTRYWIMPALPAGN